MKQKPINQQVVVVVGASSGIGRAAAIQFAARGANVVVAARNEKGLREVVDEIRKRGGKATSVVADVAKVDQVKHVAEVAVTEYGRIDTWVHAAAVYVFAPFEHTRPNEMERLVEVNLLGQMYGALAALPHLRKAGRGTLIHVSSVEGKVALPWSSVYAASKHGMVGFIDALRLEIEREGLPIAVVNVMPSTINTPLFESALTRLGVEPRGTPPIYDPEIVARTIVEAAERPQREIIVGGGGATLVALSRFAPRLTRAILLGPLGFEAQLSRVPKSPDAPNNLFTPTADAQLRVHGDPKLEEVKSSLYTRLATSAIARAFEGATEPLVRLAARVMQVAWTLRYRKQLEGGTPKPEVIEPAQKPEVVAEAPSTPRARALIGRAKRVIHKPERAKRARAKVKAVKRARAKAVKHVRAQVAKRARASKP